MTGFAMMCATCSLRVVRRVPAAPRPGLPRKKSAMWRLLVVLMSMRSARAPPAPDTMPPSCSTVDTAGSEHTDPSTPTPAARLRWSVMLDVGWLASTTEPVKEPRERPRERRLRSVVECGRRLGTDGAECCAPMEAPSSMRSSSAYLTRNSAGCTIATAVSRCLPIAGVVERR